MKYTVVVKEIIGKNGKHKRTRFNEVKKSIIKFLLKYNYCFKVGIYDYKVYRKSAENYIEIFLKKPFYYFSGEEELEKAKQLDCLLLKKLEKLSKKPCKFR